MLVSEIIVTIDQEIARMKQVRAILTEGTSTPSGNAKSGKKLRRRKRTLSPEARKRIAEAQRKRWAAQKGTK